MQRTDLSLPGNLKQVFFATYCTTSVSYTQILIYKICQFEKAPKIKILSLVLQLKAMGIENIVKFEFPSAPPAKNLVI